MTQSASRRISGGFSDPGGIDVGGRTAAPRRSTRVRRVAGAARDGDR